MIEKVDRDAVDMVGKINEIIEHLNTLELNRIEALNKLSGSKAFDNLNKGSAYGKDDTAININNFSHKQPVKIARIIKRIS